MINDILFTIFFIILALVVLAPFLAAMYYSVLILKRSKQPTIQGLFVVNLIFIISLFALPLVYPIGGPVQTINPLILLIIWGLSLLAAVSGKFLAKKHNEPEIEKMAGRAALLQVLGFVIVIMLSSMLIAQVPR